MQTIQKYAFTFFFLAWEWCRQVRGAWRRRQWRALARKCKGLAAVAMAVVLASLLLAGCTVVPTKTAAQYCELMDIALQEGDFAEAWYISAGEVLDACGVRDAKPRAEYAACRTRRFNDTSVICE